MRLCDGAYFPISYAATPDQFAADEAACASRCGAPSRLYVHRTDGLPETMHDLDGSPYIELATAFSFRTRVTSQCSCRARPWDEASAERHRAYALEARAADGDKAAAQALAMRRAVNNVRETAPHVTLASVGRLVGGDSDDHGLAASTLAFGPTVVAPLEEASVRTPGPQRYAGQLQPLAVVLDATGSPVRRHVSRADKRIELTILAKVSDEVAAVEAFAPPRPVTAEADEAGASTSRPQASKPDRHSSTGKAKRHIAVASASEDPAGVTPTAQPQTSAKSKTVRSHRFASKSSRPSHSATVASAARDALKKRIDAVEGARRSRVARADVEPDWKEVIFRPY